MRTYKFLLWKALLFFGVALSIFIACQNEEDSGFSNRNSKLEVGSDFIKLSDDSTGIAGQLVIQSNLPEVHLEWNIDSLCNLDTTHNVLSMKNGRCSLPIKWKQKLGNGNYGPDGIAYKAGVKITAGEYSKYVPLIWADEVDSVKIKESLVSTRAAGDVMPVVAGVKIFPTTLTLSEENGGTMSIDLNGDPFAILDFSEFTSDMNLDLSNFPTSITENTLLNFKWKTGGAPAFEFTARLVVMVSGMSLHGVVQYLKAASPITISASPTSLIIGGGQGAKASSVITTNDTQGWNASVTEGNWFTVTPSGTSGSSLEVTSLSPNTTGVARTGTITVTSKSNPSSKVTITVTQAPMTNITLSANPVNLKLGTSSGSSASTIITTNDPLGWTAVSSASWLSVTASGVNGSTLTVSSNSIGSSRTATVTVTSKTDPGKSITITVTQGGVNVVKVMSIGGLALGGGVKVGPVNSTGYAYINGLTTLLNYNFGPNSAAPCVFSYYNYYCGGMVPYPNESKDFASAVSALRQYDIDIACLFCDWEAGPTIGQANELLAWVDEKPSRCLIFAFDYTNGLVGLTSALGLYDRKMGGGLGNSVTNVSYNDPTFQSIMINGPFGNIYGSTFRVVDGIYGNVSLQSCQSAGFVPILQDTQGRIVAGVNPSKRIVFHGETQFCQTGVVNTNGTLTPTVYGAYPQFIANIWAWMCNQVAAGK